MLSTPPNSLHRAASAFEDELTPPPPLRRNRSSLRHLTELSRERIALRHLHAWTELYKPEYIDRHAFSPDRSLPQPVTCHDTGLAALAQLATLRIGVRRAFVTLLSRQTEYVLVESTRSMSLQSDHTTDPGDKSWLGTSCFKRDEGINDVALDGWRKARRYRERPEDIDHYYTEGMSDHWCIISDVGQNAKFKDRTLVSRAECPRFYFSVPMRDTDGAVIGSLTMLDDKPRYGVSAEEMLFSEDLSDTIAQHLFGSTVTSQRQRSERLIQALGTFNNGGSSLRDWWTGQDNIGAGRRRKEAGESNAQQQARFDVEFGLAEDRTVDSRTSPTASNEHTSRSNPARTPRSASDGNEQAASDRNEEHVSGLDFVDKGDTASQDSAGSPNASRPTRKQKASKQKFDATAEINHVYHRASNLLRESLGSAGVVFFDATAASSARSLGRPRYLNPGGDQTASSGSAHNTSTSSDDSKAQTNSDTDQSDNSSDRRSKICRVVGSSTQIQAADDTTNKSPFQLSEKDVARLVKSYPNGKVFNYAITGNSYSASDESAGSESTGTDTLVARTNTKHNRHARLVKRVVGDARSIAFFPVWDATSERYRSCLFTWTHHGNRFFDTNEDLTYLSAFGHSLRAEISRIETVASDTAKGRFISSVSHELRSPLHGVLAGIELLQDSKLTPFQEEMALSVALAGRTLLDTVNHILDYSKISNLTKDQKTDRARREAARHKSATDESNPHDMTNIDIARLTEEVVESVVSAFRYSTTFGQKPGEPSGSAPRSQSMAQLDKGDLSVTLDIEKRVSWTTPMAPGSWTRVLTNIVGNALKYTPSGLVSVRLFAKEGHSIEGGGDGTLVCLQVEDTGIGMSKEFISSDLFTPFRQADSHSAGTGLGLSIVREVAKEFNASVVVESEPERGTIVTVQFAANFTDQPNTEDNDLYYSTTPKPRQLCILQLNDGAPQTKAFGSKAVKDSMQRTAAQWLGSEIISLYGMTPKAHGSLYAVSENDLVHLHSLHTNAVKSFISSLAASGSRPLVLGQSIASAQPLFEFEGFSVKPIYIHQPIGPRKLMRAISNAKSSITTRQTSDYALHTNRAPPSSRIIREDTAQSISGDSGRTRSYFDLPIVAGNQHARKSSNVISPTSFMDASSQKTPEMPAEISTAEDGQLEEDHILLVEDNAINMRLLTALMKKQGLAYQCATNGLEALKIYKASPLRFYLILMDMSMPIMDGFESTAKIRELERKTRLRSANIAALTGVTSEDARNDAFNAGVNKYLTKPIQMKDLKQLVAETRASPEE